MTNDIKEALLEEMYGPCRHLCDTCEHGDFYDPQSSCPVHNSDPVRFCWDGVSVEQCKFYQEKEKSR